MKRRPNPWLGHRREHEGRTFMVWRTRRRFVRAGHRVLTLEWVGTCAVCGRPVRWETCAPPSPFEPFVCCPLHRESRADRRAARLVQRRRAAILDSLVSELPDGNLVTLAGDPVERDPEPTPGDARGASSRLDARALT